MKILVFYLILFFGIAHIDGRFRFRKTDKLVIKRFVVYGILFLIPSSLVEMLGYGIPSAVKSIWLIGTIIAGSFVEKIKPDPAQMLESNGLEPGSKITK